MMALSMNNVTTRNSGFEKGPKTGAVFIHLSAAYDTVRKPGLMLKLSRIIKCRRTLTVVMNILSDRIIQFHLFVELTLIYLIKSRLSRDM